jgi:uncharacterized membrane protein YkvA (DUF1232 family)
VSFAARSTAIPASTLQNWKRRAKQLQRETYALYLACRDPRTPWYARAVAWCVVAYALSPIDLIPDPIPILGHLDDLVLVPLGVVLVRRLVPPEVLEDCRRRSGEQLAAQPVGWAAAGGIVVIWILLAILLGRFIYRRI